MVNARTLRGLRQALLDCVPGRAQRGRLLEALARVPGNRSVSSVISWLLAQEAGSPGRRDSAGCPPPPQSQVRARVLTYTRSPSEVQVTMPKGVACALLEAIDNVAALHPSWGIGRDPRDPLTATRAALRHALDGKEGTHG